jgi:hypothetical protein
MVRCALHLSVRMFGEQKRWFELHKVAPGKQRPNEVRKLAKLGGNVIHYTTAVHFSADVYTSSLGPWLPYM